MKTRIIKIGTRGSSLALVQAGMVKDALEAAHEGVSCEAVVIRTSGDWSPEQGEVVLETKALYAKEIEAALLAGDVDIAVHSMKDMDSFLPNGLVIEHMLPREDVRDCLLFSSDVAKNDQKILSDLTVGTASVRRSAFLRHMYPGVSCVPLRGNVGTRIEKVRHGQVDVTLLALAGLKRLGLESEADVVLDVADFLPAAAQGTIGIERRVGDVEMSGLLDVLSCERTVLCVSAERAALRVLDGSCHTPIGAYAVFEDGDRMWLRVKLAALDGSQVWFEEARAAVSSVAAADALGADLGLRLKPHV